METDLLGTNKNAMIALGKLTAAVFGTSTFVSGLVCVPTAPATLNVSVGAGEIYSLQNIDSTAYSSMAADTTHQIMKQGIQLDAVQLACPAPATGGNSIAYLIQAAFSEVDGGAVVLPYYNASNPAQAYSGPANAGTTNNTTRDGTVVLSAKAGVSATTGSQVTPAPDAGYVGLWVVTVANGATTISAGNIVQYSNAPIMSGPLFTGRLINVQTFGANGTYTATPGAKNIQVEVLGGGGAGGAAQGTSSGQIAGGSGGGAGGRALKRMAVPAATAITIGAGGAGNNSGSGAQGGTSSFGAFVSATGGFGGGLGVAGAVGASGGSPGGTGSGGDINIPGSAGGGVFGIAPNNIVLSGSGASSLYGAGGASSSGYNTGPSASGFGAGGAGGSATPSSGSAASGGNGSPGLIIIYEYA